MAKSTQSTSVISGVDIHKDLDVAEAPVSILRQQVNKGGASNPMKSITATEAK